MPAATVRGLIARVTRICVTLALVAAHALAAQPVRHDERPDGDVDRPRWRDLPPEERRQIFRERFERLPPEEQARIRERFREAREGDRPLSQEERRQLRRDIFEHGRDLYGRPRRE